MASVVKKLMLQEIRGEFEKSPYAFISTSDGLAVEDYAKLRRSLEKVSTRSLMVKHSLAKKVFEEFAYAGAEQFLQGAVFVTFGNRDPQLISKAIVEYAKTNDKFVPNGVVFEKKVYDSAYVKQLASLPSREELLTQALVRMKSPITGFVMTLNQLLRGLVVAVNEIKKQREAGAVPA